MERAYWNHEVAEYLDIGESTLRKWCMELEKNGYEFTKGVMESRAFTDEDLVSLNHFKQLTKAKKHTKEQAAKAVVQKFQGKGGKDRETAFPMENIRSIENMLREVLQQNEKLLKRLDEIEEREKMILKIIDGENKDQ
jgi:hypothetical protein